MMSDETMLNFTEFEMESVELTREGNVQLAADLMNRFGRDMEGWYDNLHEACVIEFPFGASVGMPTRIEGKVACSGLFAKVCESVKVQFFDLVIYPFEDPSMLLIEYRGYSELQEVMYNQTYISILKFQDSKLILYKEYWNSIIVNDTFGSLSGVF